MTNDENENFILIKICARTNLIYGIEIYKLYTIFNFTHGVALIFLKSKLLIILLIALFNAIAREDGGGGQNWEQPTAR